MQPINTQLKGTTVWFLEIMFIYPSSSVRGQDAIKHTILVIKMEHYGTRGVEPELTLFIFLEHIVFITNYNQTETKSIPSLTEPWTIKCLGLHFPLQVITHMFFEYCCTFHSFCRLSDNTFWDEGLHEYAHSYSAVYTTQKTRN